MAFNSSDNWVILSSIEASIKRKIESIGVPLKDWDIRINYGIKTGYNDAFIIDEATKNLLIEEDPKSAELIRPILRGRDIKRYSYEFKNIYLICTFPSKHYNIDDYPAIKKHLLSFDKRRLEQSGEKDINGIKGYNARKKTGNKWFETQDQINYSDEFLKPKILYSEIVREPQFYYDDYYHFFPEASAFIINGSNLKPLLILLNSKIVYSIFKLFYAGGGLGEKGVRFKKAFILNLRLPRIREEETINFIKYYEELELNDFNYTKSFSNEIDTYISYLFDLSNEEKEHLLKASK